MGRIPEEWQKEMVIQSLQKDLSHAIVRGDNHITTYWSRCRELIKNARRRWQPDRWIRLVLCFFARDANSLFCCGNIFLVLLLFQVGYLSDKRLDTWARLIRRYRETSVPGKTDRRSCVCANLDSLLDRFRLSLSSSYSFPDLDDAFYARKGGRIQYIISARG